MNYYSTFIAVASDTKAVAGTIPPLRGQAKTVANLEYELIFAKPYGLTQEEVQFSVYVCRQGIDKEMSEGQKKALWSAFFAKPMACMRASPLPKSYGWGLHFNAQGLVKLIGVESEDYWRLLEDKSLKQTAAMRSKR